MKIGIVASLFPPYSVGGAEISSYYLSRGLAEAGHDVLVITPNFGRKTVLEERGRLKIYRFAFPGVLKEQLPGKIMSNPLVYFWFTRNIKSAIKWFKPDILHAQNSLVFIPTHMAGRGIKKVATLRDYTSYCDASGFCWFDRKYRCSFFTYLKCKYRWNPSLLRFFHYPYDYLNLGWKQGILRKMDGVISISNFVKDLYEKIGINSRVIHVPFDMASIPDVSLGKENARKRLKISQKHAVSYIGKLSVGKGFNHFLEMIKKMDNENIAFIIVGTGPLKNDAAEISKKYRNVKYLGKVPNERIFEVYVASDLVCFLSVSSEALGRIAIESLALGTPCIATRVGGIPEVIDNGVNGFLVSPGDIEELVKKVKILLSDKRLRDKFARNGKLKIKEEFSLEKVTNKHIEFYKKVTGLG